MAEISPTPEDARASLDEAAKQAAGLRRADSAFRPILVALAATYLAVAVLLSINPRGGNVLISDGVLITYVAGVAITFYFAWRIRAWSRVGTAWLVVSTLGFTLWNVAVIWASIATGWWGPHQPGLHFGVSAVVAVIPLLVAAWRTGRS